jgi:lipoxygenase
MNFMQEWPLKSKLDPKIYGPPESAITTEMIERDIGGYMTVNEVTCK